MKDTRLFRFNSFVCFAFSVEDARKASLGAKIVSLITPIHFGTIGVIWTQMIWFIVGWILPLMFVTGFLMWWNRVVRKRMRA